MRNYGCYCEEDKPFHSDKGKVCEALLEKGLGQQLAVKAVGGEPTEQVDNVQSMASKHSYTLTALVRDLGPREGV